jgi:hypothetical protein
MDEENMHEVPPGGPGGYGAAGSPPVIGGIPGGRPPGEQSPPGEHLPPGEILPTGDERVDNAVAGLSRLPGRPADEHVAVLEEVHGRLRDILGELNEGPGLADQDKSP